MLDYILLLIVTGCSDSEIIKNAQKRVAKTGKKISVEMVKGFIVKAQKQLTERSVIDLGMERAKALVRLELSFKMAAAKQDAKLTFDIQKEITRLLELDKPTTNNLFNNK